MATRYSSDPTERRKITTGTANRNAAVNPAPQDAPGANDAFFNKARAARTKATAPVARDVGGEEYSAGDAVASIKANDPTAVAIEGKFGRTIKGKYGTASISTPEQNIAKRDADLKAKHPAIWEKDSPENQAFVAHARQYGTDSAMKNVDNIVKVAGVGRTKPKTGEAVSADLARKAAAMGPGNPSPTTYPVPTKPASTPSAESRDPSTAEIGSEFGGEFKKRVGGVFRDAAEAVASASKKARDFVRGSAGIAAPFGKGTVGPAPDPSTNPPKKKKAPLPI